MFLLNIFIDKSCVKVFSTSYEDLNLYLLNIKVIFKEDDIYILKIFGTRWNVRILYLDNKEGQLTFIFMIINRPSTL